LIVAFDTSVLVYFFDAQAKAPIDASTGAPVSNCKERIEFLIETLQRNNAKIVIPTPALGELLVKGREAAPKWLEILHRSRHFRIAGFDERAAIEFAAVQRERVASGQKNDGATRAKAKFDDQIVAIAAVESATIIYSDDPHIKKRAGSRFEVIGIAELPLAPGDDQYDLPLDPKKEPPAPSDEAGEP
jgi:predicted nucleic acid-binding protein